VQSTRDHQADDAGREVQSRPDTQADDAGREVQSTRDAQADIARGKMQRRRRSQTGAAGWVSGRASRWSLDGPDWDFIDRQKYFWNPLMDYWFRMEMGGWERLPDPPALLVGIHSARRSPGTRGRSAFSGGAGSAALAPYTEPRTTR
jgi:hypothetical protein